MSNARHVRVRKEKRTQATTNYYSTLSSQIIPTALAPCVGLLSQKKKIILPILQHNECRCNFEVSEFKKKLLDNDKAVLRMYV